MRSRFRNQFLKDLRKLKNQNLRALVKDLIMEVDQKSKLKEVSKIKKLKGFQNYYRVRIGDYRIGISEEESNIWFERILHRKEIYKKFPK